MKFLPECHLTKISVVIVLNLIKFNIKNSFIKARSYYNNSNNINSNNHSKEQKILVNTYNNQQTKQYEEKRYGNSNVF